MLFGLAQVDAISPQWFDMLREYPILIMIIGIVYYLQKQQREDNKERRSQQKEDNELIHTWLEEMLETQRQSLSEIYSSQQQFISILLGQIESNQNDLFKKIEQNTQQLAINTGTVNEIAKVDHIVSELIAKLEQK